ncbi:MAG: S24/S26 family peptidase [Planctomycetes bacterium]|nr:S24/S26 family peptidase [Planctomycetota bacterium]
MINCLQVQGTSMRPFIRAGDYVLIKPCRPAETRVGDIVALSGPNNKLFVHRLVWRDNRNAIIKGDSVSSLGYVRINGNQTVGRVISIIKGQAIVPTGNRWLGLALLLVSLGLIPFQMMRGH